MVDAPDRPEITALIHEGCKAYEEGNHVREVEIWKQVSRLEPEDLHWQANLAMAFYRVGESEQAIIIFQYVIDEEPTISQAHNNLAVIMADAGVPLRMLLPYFSAALATSETCPHFQRHLVNFCAAASLGSDEEGLTWLERVREEAITFLTRVDDLTDSNVAYVGAIVESFSHYAHVRQCIASRDWAGAFRALDAAKQSFEEFNFNPELERIKRMAPVIDLVRCVFEFLDNCATDVLSIEAAAEEVAQLHQKASESAESAIVAGHSPLIDLLGWFVAEFSRQLDWLRNPGGDYDEVQHAVPKYAITAIAASEYVDFGSRIVELLSQCNRTLAQLGRQIPTLSSARSRQAASRRAWSRIRLHIAGSILDFAGLEEDLSREMAGWSKSGTERLRRELLEFRGYIEGQASADLYVNEHPQENIGRALLQAFLTNRGYREVPSRGGRVDVLIVERSETFVIETKIWRGPTNHDDGLVELAEYVERESIPHHTSSFYVVFDPTSGRKALSYAAKSSPRPGIETIVVSIALPTPSKKAATERKSTDT